MTGVDSAVQLLHEAFHGPVEEAWSGIEREVWTPLSESVAQASAAHREARGRVGLDGPCPAGAPETRAKLRAYAIAVREGVHAPLVARIRRDPPLATSAHRILAAWPEGDARARKLPADAGGGRSSNGRDGEGGPRGALAGLGRLLRRRRSGDGTDLRRIGAAHRERRMADGVDRHLAGLVRAWAEWLGELEAAWVRWAEAALPPASSEPVPVPGDEAPEDDWAAVAAAARELDEALEELSARAPHRATAEQAGRALEGWRTALAEGVRSAAEGRPPRPADDRAPDAGRLEPWLDWEGQAVERLLLVGALLDLLETSVELAGRIPARLAAEVEAGWARTADEVADHLERLAARVGERDRPLEAAVRDARAGAREALSGLEARLPDAASVGAAIRRAADSAVSTVQRALTDVPERVRVHPLHVAGRQFRRQERSARTLHVRDLARHAFDALRMERIHVAHEGVADVPGRLATTLSEVAEVVEYGCDAALQEADSEAAESDAPAREIAVEALRRAAGSVRGLAGLVEGSTDRIEDALLEELLKGVERLVDRSLARRVQGGLMDLGARLRTEAAELWERHGPRLGRVAGAARRGWAGARRVSQAALRRGRTIVGQAPTAGSAIRTARIVAASEEVMDGLPLVYRRLFAAEPLSDPGLLVGREAALAGVLERWRWWKEEDAVPLVVTGHPGSGLSSFLRVLEGELSTAGASTVHHELRRRLYDEAELAQELAVALDVEAAPTLDGLVRSVLAAPGEAIPDLVVLEGLELLYLRRPGGTDLIERLLTLMAETEPRAFWVAALTSSAWQMVEKSEPTAVAQIDRMELHPLTPPQLREAILHRHRRSGVPLRFLEPAEGRTLLRRRLRRARTPEARSAILEEDFFDQLYRSSQGQLRLAMFQWLRSADFEATEGILTMHPVQPLDFTFLADLGLDQNFTLKAFLEHRSLTLAEHDAIFRLPRQESFQILESLKNRHLVEPVPGQARAEDTSEVEDDVRYRIRPLVTGPVSAHLASLNIVH